MSRVSMARPTTTRKRTGGLLLACSTESWNEPDA